MVEAMKDFFINISKGDPELEDGVVFIIDKQFEDDKGQIVFELKRRDVNVERTPGNYLMKQIWGIVTFKGKEEIDRKRTAIFKQDNIMTIGNNSPRTILAWANDYDALPRGIKQNKKWSLILDMIYAADSKMEAEINTMKNAQTSESEMYNMATSSPNKYFENITDTFQKLVEAKMESQGINKPMPGQQMITQNPMNQG